MIFSNYFLNFTHFIFSHFASFVTVALISSFHSVSPQLEYYFDIHIIHSRNFLFSPSRLISAEIINVFLYPWNFSFNCIGPDYIHNPFRHFDQDLVTPYFHPRTSIRRLFLNHRCSFLQHFTLVHTLCRYSFPDLDSFDEDFLHSTPNYSHDCLI